MKFRLKAFGTDETVTRPVQISVLKDIAKFIGCSSEPYLHIDENSSVKKIRSRRKGMKHSPNDPLNVANGNFKEMLRITDYLEATDDGTEMSLALNNPDSVPFLLDRDVKFSSRLIMQRKKVDMTVEYTTTDGVYMTAVLDMLRLHMPYNEGRMLHDIQYTVALPKDLIYIAAEIVKLKNSRKEEQDRQSIINYLFSLSDGRLTRYIDPSGDRSNAELTIKQLYHSCKGWFNDSFTSIKPELSENNGQTISLSYSFYYDKPIGIHVDMPIIVYNRTISSKITNKLSLYSGSVPHHSKLVNINDQGLVHYFNPGKNAYDVLNKFKNRVIPSTDDYIKLPIPNDITRLGTMAVCIEDDKRSIAPLRDILNAFKVVDSIVDFIVEDEKSDIFKIYNSLFWLTLIEEDKFSSKEVLEIDETGLVKSKEDLDLTKRYRLLLCLNNDVNILPKSSIERIKIGLRKNYDEYKAKQDAMINEYLSANKLSVKDIYYYKEKIIDVKNNYLSTFDLLQPLYGVNSNDLERLAKIQGNSIEVFFKMIKANKVNKGYLSTSVSTASSGNIKSPSIDSIEDNIRGILTDVAYPENRNYSKPTIGKNVQINTTYVDRLFKE